MTDVTDDGVGDADTESLVLPRFLPANSYISPNMPANVLRKFFIVSSASSTTEVWLCGCVGRAALDFDVVDDCDAESEE